MKKYIYIILIAAMTLPALAQDQEPKRALGLPLEMQQLMAIREREIADIDAKFKRAVLKLRAELRQKGDTKAVLSLDSWMLAFDDPFVGDWAFHVPGNPARKFTFNTDGTWSGFYPHGSPMNGTWQRDSKNPGIVQLWINSSKSMNTKKPIAEVTLNAALSTAAWTTKQGVIPNHQGARPSASPVPVADSVTPRRGSSTLTQEAPPFFGVQP